MAAEPASNLLRVLQEELAENARARIRFYLDGVEDGELRQLEARASELRTAIRAKSPPPAWEHPDPHRAVPPTREDRTFDAYFPRLITS